MPGEQPVEHLPLGALHPSQLLVSAEKLRGVLEWWDADVPDPEPVPYLKPVEDVGLDAGVVAANRVVLADGHTRALAAVLSGVETLPVVRDPDREDLSMGVYRECVGWCVAADVRRPADLVGRVVSAETHQREWVDRCHAVDAY
jgi:hypothetical protein